jgi:hypothetical protein
MAQLPQIKRLLVEDFPDQQEWIGKLLIVLNDFMQATSNALDKNLTITDNFNQQVKTLTIVGNSSIQGTLTATANTITNCTSTLGMTAGMVIKGVGIPDGTTISSISGATITISANATVSSVGTPIIVGNNFPITFQSTLTTKVIGILPVNVFDTGSNPLVMSQPVYADWEQNNNTIIINNLSGLVVGTQYQVTFVVIGA